MERGYGRGERRAQQQRVLEEKAQRLSAELEQAKDQVRALRDAAEILGEHWKQLEAEHEAARAEQLRLARQRDLLAGAIRSFLGSLPFQPHEALGGLVRLKLAGPLAMVEETGRERSGTAAS